MKMYNIKTKYDDCKNIREILDKIDIKVFSKISFILLMIWILTPIEMIILTPLIGNDIARFIMFNILTVLGFLGLFIGVIYFLKKYYKKDKKNLIRKYLPIFIFILLLIWCFITCFLSTNRTISFMGSEYRREGLETYLAYFGIFNLGILLKNRKQKKILFNSLIIVEIIISIISLMNNDITYILMNNQEPYTGIFSQFNHYGYYLMFGILVSLMMFLLTKNNYKYIYLLPYGLLLYTLLMNDTFGCILSIIISLILVLIFFRKYKKEMFLIFITTLILFIGTYRNNQNIIYKNFKSLFGDAEIVKTVIKDTKKAKKNKDKININAINSIGTTRGVLWRYGLKYIGERPITGYGIETLDLLYIKDGIIQDRPHNILIQFGVFTGIPGIILYSLFILIILFRCIIRFKYFDELNKFIFIICLCYLISSMFGNSMFYTSPYFFIFLGLLTSNIFYLKKQV